VYVPALVVAWQWNRPRFLTAANPTCHCSTFFLRANWTRPLAHKGGTRAGGGTDEKTCAQPRKARVSAVIFAEEADGQDTATLCNSQDRELHGGEIKTGCDRKPSTETDEETKPWPAFVLARPRGFGCSSGVRRRWRLHIAGLTTAPCPAYAWFRARRRSAA